MNQPLDYESPVVIRTDRAGSTPNATHFDSNTAIKRVPCWIVNATLNDVFATEAWVSHIRIDTGVLSRCVTSKKKECYQDEGKMQTTRRAHLYTCWGWLEIDN